MAEIWGDRTAFVVPDNKSPYFDEFISYRQAYMFVKNICDILKDNGLEKGDRVIGFMSNSIENFLVMLASLRAGCIFVPLNPLLKANEIIEIVEETNSKFIFCDTRNLIELEKLIEIKGESRFKIFVVPFEEIGNGKSYIVLNKEVVFSERKAEKGEEERGKKEDIDENSDACIMFTSGTTGKSKGAILKEVSFNKKYIRRPLRITSFFPTFRKHLMIHSLPLSHVMGMSAQLTAYSIGLPVIYLGKFESKRILENVEKYKATFFVGVPTMYKMLLREDDIERRDLSSIKVFLSAADVMPIELAKRVQELTKKKFLFFTRKARFIEIYGQVELTGAATVKVHLPWMKRTGCIGIRLAGTKVRIVNSEGKRVLMPGKEGELWVKGDSVLKGYWGDDDMTKKSFEGEWFKTGDIVKRSWTGLLYFVGRDKDMLKVGGYSVFPSEIEEEIRKYPNVLDCVVFGITDELKGTKPYVAIIPRGELNSESFEKWMKEHISPYKVPRKVFVVDRFPSTDTMKVKRKILSELFIDKVL